MFAIWLNICAGILCIFASSLIYIGSPNQQWSRNRVISWYPALAAFAVLSAISGILFYQHMSTLSAIFAVLTCHMLSLSLLPLYTQVAKPLTNRIKAKSWLQRSPIAENYQSQWILKIVGSAIVGFPLAVFSASLIGLIGFPDTVIDVRSQFIMWLITPLWLLPISFIFFSRRPALIISLLAGLGLVSYSVLQFVLNKGI